MSETVQPKPSSPRPIKRIDPSRSTTIPLSHSLDFETRVYEHPSSHYLTTNRRSSSQSSYEDVDVGLDESNSSVSSSYSRSPHSFRTSIHPFPSVYHPPYPVLMMTKQHGFMWNEEVFVQRRKSIFYDDGEDEDDGGDPRQESGYHRPFEQVVEIKLEEGEIDIWPQ
ncbi:hypothetical protein BZG36_05356 [Bifiguratus adelaidae]|uniref:Uncharacterized protein n=1 Tax=Bifiguratus adelaidae TaxID=1938954 RepID=A0A261XTJ1_9FUNG|nr:hypothetical protein BZG36_05356 [Bifiguratus adelaidae]